MRNYLPLGNHHPSRTASPSSQQQRRSSNSSGMIQPTTNSPGSVSSTHTAGQQLSSAATGPGVVSGASLLHTRPSSLPLSLMQHVTGGGAAGATAGADPHMYAAALRAQAEREQYEAEQRAARAQQNLMMAELIDAQQRSAGAAAFHSPFATAGFPPRRGSSGGLQSPAAHRLSLQQQQQQHHHHQQQQAAAAVAHQQQTAALQAHLLQQQHQLSEHQFLLEQHHAQQRADLCRRMLLQQSPTPNLALDDLLLRTSPGFAASLSNLTASMSPGAAMSLSPGSITPTGRTLGLGRGWGPSPSSSTGGGAMVSMSPGSLNAHRPTRPLGVSSLGSAVSAPNSRWNSRRMRMLGRTTTGEPSPNPPVGLGGRDFKIDRQIPIVPDLHPNDGEEEEEDEDDGGMEDQPMGTIQTKQQDHQHASSRMDTDGGDNNNDDEDNDEHYFNNVEENEVDRDFKRSQENFPLKLYRVLYEVQQEGKGHIFSFFPHGRAFAVHKPKEFLADIMPRFFGTTRMNSLLKQLNLYGFRRITEGKDKGGYFHPQFIQGKRSGCSNIKRKKTTGNPNAAAAAAGSPKQPKAVPPQELTAAAVMHAQAAAAMPSSSGTNSPSPTFGRHPKQRWKTSSPQL